MSLPIFTTAILRSICPYPPTCETCSLSFNTGLLQVVMVFSVVEHPLKALQLALSDDSLGFETDPHGRFPGYGNSFILRREWLPGQHPDNLPHVRGQSTCLDLTGVNLNPHV